MFTPKEYKEIATAVIGHRHRKRSDFQYKNQLHREAEWISVRDTQVNELFDVLTDIVDSWAGDEGDEQIVLSLDTIRKLHNQISNYRQVIHSVKGIVQQKDRQDGW